MSDERQSWNALHDGLEGDVARADVDDLVARLPAAQALALGLATALPVRADRRWRAWGLDSIVTDVVEGG